MVYEVVLIIVLIFVKKGVLVFVPLLHTGVVNISHNRTFSIDIVMLKNIFNNILTIFLTFSLFEDD